MSAPDVAGGEPRSTKRRSRDDVDNVVSGLMSRIAKGHYAPGYQLRQEALAEELGVGRWPVREALRRLTAEGVVAHEQNLGYFVARLEHDEVRQIYLMRHLLESAVLRALRPADAATLEKLHRLNDEIAALTTFFPMDELRRLNTEFHFVIFRLSPYNYIVDELAGLWRRTDAYRSMDAPDESARKKIVAEHRAMIEALGEGDRDRLVEHMQHHRADSEARLLNRLL